MKSPFTIVNRSLSASIAAACVVAVAAAAFAPFTPVPAAARPTKQIFDDAPAPPAVYDDFEDAKFDAREDKKLIFVAFLKPNDPTSVKLSKLIDDNSIYLNPDRVVIFKYRTTDAKRLANFRKHFNITGDAMPIVILTDSYGKPIDSRTGLLTQEAYTAWAQEKGGKDAVDIPPDGLFNLRAAGPMVVTKELTPVRQWTSVTGSKITASLVEAKGNIGTFRTEDNDYVELDFNHLIEADKDYLSGKLPATGSSFP